MSLALNILVCLLLLYPALVAVIALACVARFQDARPLLWVLHALCEVPLYLIGWLVVPIAAYAQAYRLARNDKFERVVCEFKWRWLWLYQNPEDGVDGLRGGDEAQQWWFDQTKGLSIPARIIRWSAWRNPIGSLRFAPVFSFLIDPRRVRWVGTSADPGTRDGWFYATHGAYGGLWLETPRWQFRIGWKLMPDDANGLAPGDYRAKGCGFGVQAHKS